ncbi:hypothetical protein PVAP13_6KG156700 [Panicum virgatum]|uniref:Uncharacterized protein n=1 Tax=Panicum virgatum TaxID=38727 RepID=A0A8T0RA54_PANVG|nr:hypothetical protein PVAP13_6KG156700 [Panicum virgatum]
MAVIRAGRTGLVVLCLASLLVSSLADDTSGSGSHGAGRKMTPGMVVDEKDRFTNIHAHRTVVYSYRTIVHAYGTVIQCA